MTSFSALDIVRPWIEAHVSEGDLCVDATAGRGRDTLRLCRLAGETGRVIAFDIQPEAIESTRALLRSEGVEGRAELHLDGHEHMDRYAAPGTVSCITFNLGWLPGGDHSVNTRAGTSIEAVGKGLELLRDGGLMSICIYYGRDTGYEERDAVLNYLETIDSARYTAVVSRFVNRGGCPPIPVLIMKGK